MNLDNYEGHTPGPWKVVAKANDYRTTDVVVGKTIVATNISGNDSSLIAAAPDLLAFYLRVKEIMDMEEIEEIVRVELIWTVMQEMLEEEE